MITPPCLSPRNLDNTSVNRRQYCIVLLNVRDEESGSITLVWQRYSVPGGEPGSQTVMITKARSKADIAARLT